MSASTSENGRLRCGGIGEGGVAGCGDPDGDVGEGEFVLQADHASGGDALSRGSLLTLSRLVRP